MSFFPTVSLIMPTFNKLSRLRFALKSLNKQSYPFEKWELVIVDDGSTESVENLLDELELNYHINYIFQSNSGRSIARNQGLDVAKGEIIVFMDDDLIASPNFVGAHFQAHEKSLEKVVRGSIFELSYYRFFQDPGKGELYPEFSNSANNISELREKCTLLDLASEDYEQFASMFKKSSRFEQGVQKELSRPPDERLLSWLGFNGGNVSARKGWILKAGGFDEKLGKEWGAEDIELGYRLFKLNLFWEWEPLASNYHISHYRREFMTIGQKAHFYCLEKHPSLEMSLLWPYLEGRFDIDKYNYLVKNKITWRE